VSKLAAKRRASHRQNVGDYVGELRTLGRDSMYSDNAEAGLVAVGEACGWKALRDIDRAELVAYLERRKAGGTAPRTLANIAATLPEFCRWAVRGRRLDRNPVEDVVRVDQTGDRRRKRRALTPDEVKWLLGKAGSRELL
jgi:site-specific recombinase XerC